MSCYHIRMDLFSAEAPHDLNASIDDVSASTWEYIWHKHGALFIGLSIFCVSLSAIISYALYEAYSLHLGTFDPRSFVWPLLPLAALWSLYAYQFSRVQHLFIQQMAIALGFTYSNFAPSETVSGTFFTLGHSPRLGDVMSGTYKGHPVRIYSYQYTVGYGKDRHTYTYTVFELKHDAPLPHVIMNIPELFAPGDVERVELRVISAKISNSTYQKEIKWKFVRFSSRM
jgi:hypothetical protein